MTALLAYLTILTAMLAGSAQGPVYIPAVTALVLTALSAHEHRELYGELTKTFGLSSALPFYASSFLNGALVSGSAYVFGWAAWSLWT